MNGLAKELQHPIFTPVAQARPHSCVALHSADSARGLMLCHQLSVLGYCDEPLHTEHHCGREMTLGLCMQAAGRRVAYHTFSHVLDLDVGFHLERRTGALSRILERGTSATL